MRSTIRSQIRATLNKLQKLRSRPLSERELRADAIIFAPHQDDETLGCGGTILRKSAAGAKLTTAYLTDGSGSHAHLMDKQKLADIRAAEARAANKILGIGAADVAFLGGPDSSLADHGGSIVPKIRAILKAEQPAQVFIPYARDRLPDHIATHDFVMAALRAESAAVTVVEYPVWFWNHWPWMQQQQGSALHHALRFCRDSLALIYDFNISSNIAQVIDSKRAALACHATQMTAFGGSPDWLTLHDVAEGDFLRCLLRDAEIFRLRELRA